MRESHAEVFLDAADKFQCWIVVRPLNLSSELYLDGKEFDAKPLSCKAKTANNPHHPLLGLVVSPKVVPGAFRPETLFRAKKWWKKFEPRVQGPGGSGGYTLETTGRFAGCVKYCGKFLHGDYDLLVVIPVDDHSRPLPNHLSSQPRKVTHSEFGDTEFLSKLVEAVMAFVNTHPRMGKPMVKHGADFDDMEDFRANDEWCDWFGPKRKREKKFYFASESGRALQRGLLH